MMRIRDNRTQLVKRRPTLLNGVSSRVITRPHIPGDKTRCSALVDRVSAVAEDDVEHLLEAILQDFSARHRNFRETLGSNFERLAAIVPKSGALSESRRLLLGAYVTAEYSVEAAALFNPSIVPHPDQKGVAKGSLRFIMSFRATGEGHISSIEFRSGIVDDNLDLYIDPVSQYVATPEIHADPTYDRRHFRRKLEDIGASQRVADRLLQGLYENFTFDELEVEIEKFRSTRFRVKDKHEAIDMVLWLARSNYEVVFDSGQQISERVIFPVSENESSGIEDARFVRFVDDDRSVHYYATYTAFNGFAILPQLLETTDFLTFKMHTLSGDAARNKGMALFPRKINGRYVMLLRQDGVNNYIAFSDRLHSCRPERIPTGEWAPAEVQRRSNCGAGPRTRYSYSRRPGATTSHSGH